MLAAELETEILRRGGQCINYRSGLTVAEILDLSN